MTEARLREILAALARDQQQLEALANATEDAALAALRQAESYALERLQAIIAAAPDWESLPLEERLAWWIQQQNAIDEILINSGYADGVRAYVDAYDEFADLSARMLRDQGLRFAGYNEDLVAALKTQHYERFMALGADANREIVHTLFQDVLTGRPKAGALADLKGHITGEYPWGKRMGRYEWHAGTYVRTSHFEFVREANAAQAQELGLEEFLYLGPADKKTRPFCAGLVGKTFKREEIDEMENGQRPNVFITGGGWNCRHSWVPVTPGLAAALSESPEVAREVLAA